MLETVQGSMQAEGLCLQVGLLPGAISHFFSPPLIPGTQTHLEVFRYKVALSVGRRLQLLEGDRAVLWEQMRLKWGGSLPQSGHLTVTDP